MSAFQIFKLPKITNIDSSVRITAGAKLWFYATTTVTPQDTYTDADLTIPSTNPVIADANGVFAPIYLNPALVYKITLTTSADVLIYTIDPANDQLLSQAVIGGFLYPRTAAEIAAGVTPVFYYYPPGDLRRYGCDTTGATDNSTQIANAILAAVATGGVGYIYHPGGNISHASQILIPNGLAIVGESRAKSVFTFSGTPSGSPVNTRSAWRYESGFVNSSGYAQVMVRHVTFSYTNTVNFAACLELNAGGWSYFDVYDVRCTGGASYAIVLDAVELCYVHECLLESTNTSTSSVVWITNGPDRSAGQTRGFTNLVTIENNQISGSAGSFGLLDDGGNGHTIKANNFNQSRFPMQCGGLQGGVIEGNSFETTLTTGSANVIFTNVSGAGDHVGPCSGVQISGNGFFGATSASGNLLDFQSTLYTITAITQAASAIVTVSTVSTINPFQGDEMLSFTGVVGMTQINGLSGRVTALGGSSGAWTATVAINSGGFSAYVSGGSVQNYHVGFHIAGNNFGSTNNRVGAINLTFLANSWCGPNNDFGNSSMSHYRNVHNDAYGNTLLATENGDLTSLNVSGPTHGDTRFPEIFSGGIRIGTVGTATCTSLLIGSKTFDWPSVAVGANTNTTVTVTGAALGDNVVDCTMSIDIGSTAILHGHVEAANTVRVILQNVNAVSALDLASATLSVLVAKAS